MRDIYLASGSERRKALLNISGLKFRVLSGRVKERKEAGYLSYAQLAKRNALAKARDVAKRVTGGVVIAADTIVVQDKKIFGKPRDLKEARFMLKRLSRKPQWIYTGIAIIDKDRRRVKLACEKTKVFMDRLTKSEINNYFAGVSPLDKAGAFDIQGKGAFFIRRIEGCFSNVVGLPLRRLRHMLKELGIKVFLFLLCALPFSFCFILGGCSTEYNIATGRQESFYYNTDKEVKIGESVARQVEKQYKLADDALMQKRLEDIGVSIAGVCDRKDIEYHFKVLDEEEINAVSLPGGFIYVNKGLIEKVADDDELAAVLAHEIGHIVARHSIKKLQAIMGYSILRVLAVAVPQGAEVGNAADAVFTEILLGYSRDDELLADQLGARYTKLAGYNPQAMITFLERLQEINRRKPLKPKTYFKTHPYVPDRVRIVKQELGEKMDFADYINIEEIKGR